MRLWFVVHSHRHPQFVWGGGTNNADNGAAAAFDGETGVSVSVQLQLLFLFRLRPLLLQRWSGGRRVWHQGEPLQVHWLQTTLALTAVAATDADAISCTLVWSPGAPVHGDIIALTCWFFRLHCAYCLIYLLLHGDMCFPTKTSIYVTGAWMPKAWYPRS